MMLVPSHADECRWLEQTLSRPEPVRVAWVSLLAFLQISTDHRVPGETFLMAEAVSIVNEWLALPNFGVLLPGERHWEVLADMLSESQARGPLVTDAHLAALAVEHGATLCTTDRDFRRFSGLRAHYPLAAG